MKAKTNTQHVPIIFLLPIIISLAACDNTSNTSNGSSSIVRSSESVELAVIGDAPYQPEETAEFPDLIAAINADPFVTKTVHVGDIKSGATECSDQRYQDVYSLFQTFDEPLVYTIGDNEWTDCGRNDAGAYDPEERLGKLREIFFNIPGTSLGGNTMLVEAQPNYPENQLWQEKGIVFSTLHVVGSNNNLDDRPGMPGPVEQSTTGSSEYGRRSTANIAWMRGIFNRANQSQSAGIALFLHADMWKLRPEFDADNFAGFKEIVQELSIQAEAFGKPVLIVSGDNHHYRVDAGVPWFSLYDISPASNVTQIIVEQGIEFYNDGTQVRHHWLRLVADATTEAVFDWELVSGN